MESNCYNYKLKTFKKGIFDRSTDATYIIHLEGNGRYDTIMQQLEKYHPTKLVYIAFNKGYKKCKKNLKQDLPKYDLIDAFLNVFKHAREQGYNNILVLEDDFMFSELVLDPVVSTRVNTFIKDQGDTSFIYLLGSLPLLQLPYDNYNSIAFATGGMHSVVYSRKFIEETLKRDKNTIDDWDLDSQYKIMRYTYYKPLCHQIFLLTENRKSWFESSLLLLIIDNILRLFNLTRSVEPGYTIFNIVSKLLFFLSLILISYLVWYLARKLGLSTK
jgi:hypothetical protein